MKVIVHNNYESLDVLQTIEAETVTESFRSMSTKSPGNVTRIRAANSSDRPAWISAAVNACPPVRLGFTVVSVCT